MNNSIKKNKKSVYVTQPFLPDLDEFIPYFEKIWSEKLITNNGPLHRQLEGQLSEFLDVPYVSLFSNGTLALITALQVLGVKGEVITTPYSFVATTHSMWWNNIKPVFVDIEPEYCNLDPKKIEAAITPNTSAILPVHVYGNACHVKQIDKVAKAHDLKVIYDAAHAFGVKYKGQSLLNFGDLSILSFHATKVYNTFEGGAIVCHDIETKRKIDELKNFGFRGETQVSSYGMNAKMNELQAVAGILQLKYIDQNIEKRQKISRHYQRELVNIKGITFLQDMDDLDYNYAYFPIFIDAEQYGMTRDELYQKLKDEQIFGRRYFYPLISNFPLYSDLKSSDKNNLPVANEIADRVLCLPIYPGLKDVDIERIIDVIRK